MKRSRQSKRAASEEREETPVDPVAIDPVTLNIATIAEMRARAEQQVDRHQRFAETVTASLGRPRFLYIQIVLMIGWVVFNVVGLRFGWRRPDPPPFNLMISVVNVAALLMATVVLITQNRQGKIATRREHLDLQINLLTEQRTAKIIALLEELRRDLPTVQNRVDPEADALASSVDPNVVLTALENELGEVIVGAGVAGEDAMQTQQESGNKER